MTRHLLKLILLGGVLLGLVASATAQAPFWEVRFYDSGANQVVTLTAAGVVSRVDVPTQLDWQEYNTSLVLAPNGRYLAIGVSSETVVRIADLQTASCCTTLPNPTNSPLDSYLVGAFSPDSSQFASGYISQNGDGGVMVVDAASGTLLRTLPKEQFQVPFAATAFVDGWRLEGIYFVPTCWACEGTISGEFQIWNPTSNSVSPAGRYFDYVYGAQLLSGTGEYIYARYDEDFPLGQMPGMFADANVVAYYPNGVNPLENDGQVVYFNESNLILPQAQWVANGAAFLLKPYDSSQAVLNYRDGSQQAVNMPVSEVFLIGTPDGWLTFDTNTNAIQHYLLDPIAQSLSTRMIAQAGGQVDVLNAPELGFDLDRIGFANNIQPPPPVVCPGFQASRLKVNMFARVTPGPANNFRAGPSLSAQQIGQIPGGEYFLTLEGPVCANNMAWWRVDYNGQIGWTSEGTGNDYWLEP